MDALLPLLSVWQTFVIDTLLELLKMCKHYGKPAAIYTPNAVAKSIAIRAKHRIPIFETAEQAVWAGRVAPLLQDYAARATQKGLPGEAFLNELKASVAEACAAQRK